MFGMGFFEILLVLIVAVIALGPEKLPGAAVEVVKFFKKFKRGLEDAKTTLDTELNISEMKREADMFKASIDDVSSGINSEINNVTQSVNVDIDDIASLEDKPKPSAEPAPKEAKKTKKAKKENISFDQGKA